MPFSLKPWFAGLHKLPARLCCVRARAPHRELFKLLLEEGLDAREVRDELGVGQRLGRLPLDPPLRQHLRGCPCASALLAQPV